MENRVNRRIGDYEVLRRLGFGGMGEVLQVRHLLTGRVEAMKVLLPNYVGNRQRQERFLREIQTVAKLEHPNIARLCTAATFEDQIVMVMDYVDGVTVESMVDGNPLPVGKAVRYMAQALQALAYAHRQGIVHRDFKPANLMVTADGTVKLMDFGIALTEGARLTQNGSTVGTFYFMSPEQVRGEEIDGRSDIYAAGVTLYEMVTGRTPFTGTTPNTLMDKHVNEAPTPPSAFREDLPTALNDVILKMLAKAPADRFQTAAEAREALEAAVPAAVRTQDNQVSGRRTTETETPVWKGDVVAGPIGRPVTSDEAVGPLDAGIRKVEPVEPPTPPRGRMWIQIGVVAAVLAGFGGVYAVMHREPAPPPKPVVNAGTVSGNVTDAQGSIVPGATAVLQSTAQGERKTVTVARNGEYVFSDVAAGDYVLTVSAPTFLEYKTPRIEVNADKNLRLDVKLANPSKPVPKKEDEAERLKKERAARNGPLPGKGSDTLSKGAGSTPEKQDFPVKPPPPPISPEEKAAKYRLDAVDEQAAPIDLSVTRKQQEMAAQHLQLRSSILGEQRSMNDNLTKAHQALLGHDVDEADHYMAQAKLNIANLQNSLGLR